MRKKIVAAMLSGMLVLTPMTRVSAEPIVDSTTQSQYDEKQAKYNELVESGMSRSEAKTKAQEWVDTQAALHNPDQIAGGYADQIGGMGDKKINSSIGSQWKYRIDEVDEQIQAMAKNMSDAERKNTYLNIKLKY